jgi:hypothetical protein
LAERASMRKSFVYLLNRELSQALGAWAEMAVERAELMRKWTCGVLRCATDGWAGAAASRRAARASARDVRPRGAEARIVRPPRTPSSSHECAAFLAELRLATVRMPFEAVWERQVALMRP